MNGYDDRYKLNGVTENGNHSDYSNGKNGKTILDNKENGLVPHIVVKSSGHVPAESLQLIGTSCKKSETLVNSWYCSMTLLNTTASTMMSVGLAFGALNPTMDVLSSFYEFIYQTRYNATAPKQFTEVAIALTISMPFLGGLLGALSLGLFLRYLTRRKAMLIINIINTIGVMFSSIIGYAVQSYESIIIGRLIMGFVSGVAMTMVPMIISESSTKQRAPFYLSLIGINLSLGGLMGLAFGLDELLGNEQFWPLLLALPAIPSMVYIVSAPWLPETPSYFISIKRNEQALNTLKRLRKKASCTLLKEELAGIRREQDSQGKSNHSLPLKSLLSRRGYQWQLFLVIMVFLESEYCGVNAIGVYTNRIFIAARIPEDYVTYASLIVYFVQFLVSLTGPAAVDRWGAKRLSVLCLTVMGLSMGLLTVSVKLAAEQPAVSYVSVAAVSIYILSWGCGPNITLFPLVTALTTEATREASFKLGGVIFWISSWLVSFSASFLMDELKEFAYLIWIAFDLFFAFFFYLCIPETHGKTPEQIQVEIHSNHRRSNVNETAMQPLQST